MIFFYIEKGEFVLAIAGSFFVVSGELVRDKGTNLFYDPHADMTFQLVGLESREWEVSGFGSLNMLREAGHEHKSL